MISKLALAVVVIVVIDTGCSKQEQASRKHATESPTVRPGAAPEAGSGSIQGAPKTEALTPLVSLARGKRLRINGFSDVEPLEITVPPDVTLEMEGLEEGNELPPRARLKGPALDIRIYEPDAGFFTLSQDKGMVQRGNASAKFIRAEETGDGHLLIVLETILSAEPPRYNVTVSRPKLKVECGAVQPVERLVDAERAASVCLSLRAASASTKN